MESITAGGFPVGALVPKTEQEAEQFISRNPEWDGRGIVVAIFDSGTDPGAHGLQRTTDGKPKIVDLIDCTGDGDVDMTTVRRAQGNVLEGLSGRKLTLGADWVNPSGDYRVGVKRGYELFPNDLVERLKEERKKKFELQDKALRTELERQLDAWQTAHPDSKKLSSAEKRESKELKAKLEQLTELFKAYEDPGPVYDVVAFHDGSVWRVVLDLAQSGDLSAQKPLTDYHREHLYGTFSDADMLNFAVNVYDDGDVVSLVTHASSHGTHVSGIVAAHVPDQPECNGVAPGAQLIGVKIGDRRLGTEETVTGLVRALSACVRNKTSIINLSYGEPCERPDIGRFVEILNEAVNKHGIVFVSSAGNNGPALSTVGAPGGTSSASIGVGAFVSADMMQIDYSMRERLPEYMYTWTSRGPTTDGALGVSVCAPGGAITCVPNSTLKRGQLMNGTSMSSPNCAGSIALLLSALKQEKIEWSPHSIKRALENTARKIQGVEVFAQGHGLVQLARAHGWLRRSPFDARQRFEVSVPSRGSARGVYLREAVETSRPGEFGIKVDTVFHEDTPNSVRVAFEQRIVLQATRPWIHAPQFFVAMHGDRSFSIKVDPTQVPVGEVDFGEVQGFSASAPDEGPLFRIPVTVVRSLSLPPNEYVFKHSAKFKPGHIERRFIEVPHGAYSLSFRIRGRQMETARQIVAHFVQLSPQRPFRSTESYKTFSLSQDDDETFKCPVLPSVVLEVCVAQFWSSLGDSEVEYEVEFHGLTASALAGHVFDGKQLAERVDVRAVFRAETIEPSVTLQRWQTQLRPSSATIRPLSGVRDRLPNGTQVSALELCYSFKLRAAAEVRIVAPLSALLYENPFENQFWYVVNAETKRLYGHGDAFPKHYNIKLPKGSYQLRLQMRHDQVEHLQKFKSMPLALDRKLDKEISLKVYGDLTQAALEAKEFGSRKLKAGDSAVFWIRGIPDAEIKARKMLPKEVKSGDTLVGKLTYQKEVSSSFEFSYVVPSEIAADSSTSNEGAASASNSNGNGGGSDVAERLLKSQLSFLGGLLDAKKFDDYRAVSEPLLAKAAGSLQARRLALRFANESPNRQERLDEVVAAADDVIKCIDTAAIAEHLGVKHDADEPDADKSKTIDENKSALIDALKVKAFALLDKETLDDASKAMLAVSELKKWADIEEEKLAELAVRYYRAIGQPAAALRVARKIGGDTDNDKLKRTMYSQTCELISAFGWDCWSAHFEAWKVINFPVKLPLF